MTTFTLTIKLGNAAMPADDDIARDAAISRALREVADRVTLTSSTGGVIRDANGNTVGSWEMTS